MIYGSNNKRSDKYGRYYLKGRVSFSLDVRDCMLT